MKKRNYLPESNGLYKVNMKEPVSKATIRKRILTVICLIIFGFIMFQQLSNYFGNRRIKSNFSYITVNGEKYDYDLSGKGEYTIVFDGAIATTADQWKDIRKDIEEQYDVQTFVYNRAGYGESDLGEEKSPKKQAEDLKILLRKAGVTDKFILVGEEYGSLVMTNFASLFPDSVSGMLLIKPLDENKVKSEEFRSEIKKKYKKSKLEVIGTYFGITKILNKFNLTYKIDSFEKNLSNNAKEEYEVKSYQTTYRKALSYEFHSLYNYKCNSQKDGLMKDKPLYIISNDKDDKLKSLGNSEFTTVYKTSSKEKLISVTDKNSVIDGISTILKARKKIDKKS